MNNETAVAKKITFGQYMKADITQQLIQRTLGDERHAQRFTAAILSAVSVTPGLQECDPKTVLSGAFLGDALQLPPNPQLGRFYLVPFKNKKNPYGSVATFILGFKGYIELAIRTGQYSKIIVLAIKEGEIVKPWNALTETIDIKLVEDEDKCDALPTIGYYAMFQMVNGFTKAMYWSKDKMLNHANRYSKAFNKDQYRLLLEGKIKGITLKDIQEGTYFEDRELYKTAQKMSSFWYKDFDEMANKTMIRQLISKWGIMSVDIQRAFDADDHSIDPITLTPNEDGVYGEAPQDDPEMGVPDFVDDSDKEISGATDFSKGKKGEQTKLGDV